MFRPFSLAAWYGSKRYSREWLYRTTGFVRISRDFRPAFWRKLLRPRLAALQTPEATQLNRSGVLSILHSIFNLPRGDVAYELAELDGVARAGDAFHCHGLSMPPASALCTRNRLGLYSTGFKLTHYLPKQLLDILEEIQQTLSCGFVMMANFTHVLFKFHQTQGDVDLVEDMLGLLE